MARGASSAQSRKGHHVGLSRNFIPKIFRGGGKVGFSRNPKIGKNEKLREINAIGYKFTK